MSFHNEVVGTDIHVIHAFTFADAGARTGATGLVTADLGKVAKQTDTNDFYILIATTPTWVQLTSATNATHTGEVTGDTTLTVDPTAITNKTNVTAANGDLILISDVSDSNTLKKVTAQSIADLGSGGGGGVFGTEFEVFESLSQSNTGAAFVTKLSATSDSKPVGKYRIGFAVDVTNSDGTDIWKVRFSVNGALIHQHTNGNDEYENKPDGNNDWEVYSTFAYFDVVSPQTIALLIEFGTTDNTARASNAIIEIWRVS